MNYNVFEWVVVGAGPAGIASVGKLIDAGVKPTTIAWIDPKFKIGDFGSSWGYVMSNTPVESFLKFYNDCKAFNYSTNPNFMINKSKPESSCPLMIAAQPLYWITDQLKQNIPHFVDEVVSLKQVGESWSIKLNRDKELKSKKIIMAVGSNARELSFPTLTAIPLKNAMDLNKLRLAIAPSDYIAIFGSAQSARSVITNLRQISAQKIILFYRTEHLMKRHLGNEDLAHIELLEMTPANLLQHIPECNKAIYAIGFDRRHIPIDGLPDSYGYDKKTGEIAPGIYGLGIAFPEIMHHELGQVEYRVTAMWPFMKRLNKLLPQWLSS